MRTLCIPLLVALTIAGASLAHPEAGTPKNYCEDQSEWTVHDYVAGVSQFYLSDNIDGNQAGDCDGLWTLGTLCPEVGSDPVRDTRLICGYSDLVGDYDHHSEFAIGGATIYARGGDGSSPGTLACYGEEAHHAAYGLVEVNDTVLGLGVTFYVMAQGPSAIPGGPPCGDNVLQPCSAIADLAGLTCDPNDQIMECVGSCLVLFPPGVDGAYFVFVEAGVAGHVYWMEGSGGVGGAGGAWALPGDRPTTGTADP